MQHQLGHVVDSLHYQRIQQDTQWAIGEFRKAWQTEQLVTESDLRTRDQTVQAQAKRIEQLESKLEQATRATRLVEKWEAMMESNAPGLLRQMDETQAKILSTAQQAWANADRHHKAGKPSRPSKRGKAKHRNRKRSRHK
jgi:hypothetical protein